MLRLSPRSRAGSTEPDQLQVVPAAAQPAPAPAPVAPPNVADQTWKTCGLVFVGPGLEDTGANVCPDAVEDAKKDPRPHLSCANDVAYHVTMSCYRLMRRSGMGEDQAKDMCRPYGARSMRKATEAGICKE